MTTRSSRAPVVCIQDVWYRDDQGRDWCTVRAWLRHSEPPDDIGAIVLPDIVGVSQTHLASPDSPMHIRHELIRAAITDLERKLYEASAVAKYQSALPQDETERQRFRDRLLGQLLASTDPQIVEASIRTLTKERR